MEKYSDMPNRAKKMKEKLNRLDKVLSEEDKNDLVDIGGFANEMYDYQSYMKSLDGDDYNRELMRWIDSYDQDVVSSQHKVVNEKIVDASVRTESIEPAPKTTRPSGYNVDDARTERPAPREYREARKEFEKSKTIANYADDVPRPRDELNKTYVKKEEGSDNGGMNREKFLEAIGKSYSSRSYKG